MLGDGQMLPYELRRCKPDTAAIQAIENFACLAPKRVIKIDAIITLRYMSIVLLSQISQFCGDSPSQILTII